MQAALGLLEERTAATRKGARCLSLSTGRVAEGTAICGNGSIPGKAELGQAMARPGGAHAHRGRARWQPGQRARFPGRARFMSECGEAAGSAGARKITGNGLKVIPARVCGARCGPRFGLRPKGFLIP